MADLPRVTDILKFFGLIDAEWFQPKHSRRGRYVDYWCNEIGHGRGVSEEWYARSSGSAKDNDEVVHEETRPYMTQYSRALAETGAKMTHCAFEIINHAAGYIGHGDQLWFLDGRNASVELKTGGEADWHRLQSGAYLPGITSKFQFVPRRYNLYLNPDSYKLVARNDPQDVKDFIVLAQAWHVLRRWRKD